MRLTYDATTDIAYLSFRLVRPGELLGPTLLLEHDRDFPGAVALDFCQDDGRAVGLEFQMASNCLPTALLATAERTDGRSMANRFDERVAPHLPAPLRTPGAPRREGSRDGRH